MVDKKIIKSGEEIVIERNVTAEVPYELVKISDANGNSRLFTRNIRDDAGVADKQMNVAKQKAKEAEVAMEVAEKAKSNVKKKFIKKEE